MSLLSYAHFLGISPTKSGVKSDGDDHGSVCAVSGVLKPPGEEERKKEPFNSVERNPILAFFRKKIVMPRKKQENVIFSALIITAR